MSKKRTSLDAVFGGENVQQDETMLDRAEPAIKEIAVQKQESRKESLMKTEKKGREDIKQQAVYLPESVYEQLRKLAFDERKKMHEYYLEGLDRVFKNRGLKSLSELSKE